MWPVVYTIKCCVYFALNCSLDNAVLSSQQLQKRWGWCDLQWAVLLRESSKACKHPISDMMRPEEYDHFFMSCCKLEFTVSVHFYLLNTFKGLQRKSLWPQHQCLAEENEAWLCMATSPERWGKGECVCLCVKTDWSQGFFYIISSQRWLQRSQFRSKHSHDLRRFQC